MNEKWNASEHLLAHLLRRDSACGGPLLVGSIYPWRLNDPRDRIARGPTVIRRRDPDGIALSPSRGVGAVGACETVGSGAVTDAGRDGEEREGPDSP